MKALLLTVLLATNATAAEEKVTLESFCETYSVTAKVVMSARQDGAKLSKFMSYSEHTRVLAITAYKQPKYSSAEYKNESITKFENTAFLWCITGGYEALLGNEH